MNVAFTRNPVDESSHERQSMVPRRFLFVYPVVLINVAEARFSLCPWSIRFATVCDLKRLATQVALRRSASCRSSGGADRPRTRSGTRQPKCGWYVHCPVRPDTADRTAPFLS